MKKMDDDVQLLKEFMREKIGHNWRTATRENTFSKLGIDAKVSLPWTMIANAHGRGVGGSDETVAQYVLRHVQRLAPWQRWRP